MKFDMMEKMRFIRLFVMEDMEHIMVNGLILKEIIGMMKHIIVYQNVICI